MLKKNQSCAVNSREAQMELQEKEIKERLNHIKNKINAWFSSNMAILPISKDIQENG